MRLQTSKTSSGRNTAIQLMKIAAVCKKTRLFPAMVQAHASEERDLLTNGDGYGDVIYAN